jgi:hypothetical protein
MMDPLRECEGGQLCGRSLLCVGKGLRERDVLAAFGVTLGVVVLGRGCAA